MSSPWTRWSSRPIHEHGGPTSLIDELMPRFDGFEHHALVVDAEPADVYAAIPRVDLGRSWLVGETRLLCTDAASRRSFRRRVIRPFSGLIRIALLRAVAREARGRTR
jgi:hypothetical protein